mgnify:CR=1 FL=1
MKIEVFDDYPSIGHFLLGACSLFLPQIFYIFFAYELIEFCFKKKRKLEKARDFIGDLFEYLFGVGIVSLVFRLC